MSLSPYFMGKEPDALGKSDSGLKAILFFQWHQMQIIMLFKQTPDRTLVLFLIKRTR